MSDVMRKTRTYGQKKKSEEFEKENVDDGYVDDG